MTSVIRIPSPPHQPRRRPGTCQPGDRGGRRLWTGQRELIAELRAAEHVAGIRLVGGAALALRYFDRGTTQDLDALHIRPGSDEQVTAAAARVVQRHDWDPDWLNFDVTGADALPTLGREVEWKTIYDQDGILIHVASQEALQIVL
ncbi:MAG: hypothetical protein Q7T71_02250 [Herbiconiux sp.]|nr:hypothetical protein [Herbiconiux sp.]